jgi:Protein of unknown function (DUF4435)
MKANKISNSIEEHLTPHSIASSIRMERSLFHGSFLIVEGSTDAKIYSNFIEEDQCQIEIAFSKENATEIIEILNNDNFDGALTIVDADFDILDGKIHQHENIFLTDFHDIECLIFTSPALEKILAEFGSESKIKKIEKAHEKSIREIIIELGAFVGYLLKISLSEDLAFHFGNEEKKLDFSKFINKKDLTFDLDKFVTVIKNNSEKFSVHNQQIIEKIHLLAEQNLDLKHIVRGKDLTEILCVGLREFVGTNNAIHVNADFIIKSMRVAYDFRFFASTELYSNVKNWEKANVPYKVFI